MVIFKVAVSLFLSQVVPVGLLVERKLLLQLTKLVLQNRHLLSSLFLSVEVSVQTVYIFAAQLGLLQRLQ